MGKALTGVAGLTQNCLVKVIGMIVDQKINNEPLNRECLKR